METEEARIRALEDEFQVTKDELKRILLEIRGFLMDATTPIGKELIGGKLPEQADSEEGV